MRANSDDRGEAMSFGVDGPFRVQKLVVGGVQPAQEENV